jgi:(1->4)-alpha-D-glucan 1-alpha-D-glucosylmutase
MTIDDGYTDFFGRYRAASEETKRAICEAVGQDAEEARGALEPVYVFRAHEPLSIPGVSGERFEPGYYDHEVDGVRTTLIAVPPHAYVPEELDAHGVWGVAAQLYSLRSARNWGIGDFGDLARFAQVVGDAGGACVALNPLHALHLTNPRSASPYSPLSRLFLNPLYIDVPAASRALGVSLGDSVDENALSALREPDLVDYQRVTHIKLRELRRLYNGLSPESEPYRRFRSFVEQGGERLHNLALYQALMEFFAAQNAQTFGWMQWPQEFQRPGSTAVQAHAAQHPRHIEFYAFLQWLADEQLAHASRAASHMQIGLYRDLAVGVDPGSADVWMDREAFMLGIAVGAPPDQLNEQGQHWGLPPLNPRVLRKRAFAPFIGLLRANMRHAGALRIDHVMGLMRLFCIPAGTPSAEGTYLHYPFEEMLGVLALESVRNRCMIIGEDLGTVPEGFRERMARERVFSSRLLYFENDPQQYPPDAVASTGTHDLPPLRRYWEKDGTLPEDADDDMVLHLVTATYRRLGVSPARLVLAQIEDMLLQREQINTPGTFDEVPNWQRKVPINVEDLASDRRFDAVAKTLNETRR